MKILNVHNCIVRGLRLKKECGVTRRSISNAKILNKKMLLDRATLHFYDTNDCRLHTEWTGFDGGQDVFFSWDFTGLSAGYCGEGSRGLIEVLELLDIPVSRDGVFNLKRGVHRLFKSGEEPVRILEKVTA